ncbi:MAG: SRPBCC domain-containing protein [Acidimicrobiales bacterium]
MAQGAHDQRRSGTDRVPAPSRRAHLRGRCREHPWGTVEVWEPPARLVYRWHLFFAPEEATTVEVTFTGTDAGTAVRIEQRGWEALGEAGPPRRERTAGGWAAVTAPFRALLDTDATTGPREAP